MRLTKNIVAAIRKAIDHHGSSVELARLTGIKQHNFSRYLSGEVKNVTMETWTKLIPELKPFIDMTKVKLSPSFCNPVTYENCKFIADPVTKRIVRILDALEEDELFRALELITLEFRSHPSKHAVPASGLEVDKSA